MAELTAENAAIASFVDQRLAEMEYPVPDSEPLGKRLQRLVNTVTYDADAAKQLLSEQRDLEAENAALRRLLMTGFMQKDDEGNPTRDEDTGMFEVALRPTGESVFADTPDAAIDAALAKMQGETDEDSQNLPRRSS